MPQILDENLKSQIEKYVTQQLKPFQEIDRIFIEQKDKDVFRAVVIIREVDPGLERKVFELKREIGTRFQVPSTFAVVSGDSSTAAIINP